MKITHWTKTPNVKWRWGDHFEFPIDDDLGNNLFSRLLSNAMVWWAQPSNNGNANLNILAFYDFIQMHDAPPLDTNVHVPVVEGQHTSM
jgi:hypothetical protein